MERLGSVVPWAAALDHRLYAALEGILPILERRLSSQGLCAEDEGQGRDGGET
jgi:hypothetical protein